MKNLFPYLTLISMSVFGIWVSFTWNIPVDNQIEQNNYEKFISLPHINLNVRIRYLGIIHLEHSR